MLRVWAAPVALLACPPCLPCSPAHRTGRRLELRLAPPRSCLPAAQRSNGALHTSGCPRTRVWVESSPQPAFPPGRGQMRGKQEASPTVRVLAFVAGTAASVVMRRPAVPACFCGVSPLPPQLFGEK